MGYRRVIVVGRRAPGLAALDQCGASGSTSPATSSWAEEVGRREGRHAHRGRSPRPPSRGGRRAARSSPRCCSPVSSSIRGACASSITSYLGLMFSYGAVNCVQDAWNEQFAKRGWTDTRIPSAILPSASPIWLVVVGSPRLHRRAPPRGQARRHTPPHDAGADGLPRLREVRARRQDLRARADHGRRSGRRAADARVGRGGRRPARGVANRAHDPPRHGPRGAETRRCSTARSISRSGSPQRRRKVASTSATSGDVRASCSRRRHVRPRPSRCSEPRSRVLRAGRQTSSRGTSSGGRSSSTASGEDRRDRGVCARRSGEPLVRGRDASERVDVRPARSPLRLPLVRHPLVRERRLRRRGDRRGGAAPRARADPRARRDARATRLGRRPLARVRAGETHQALGITGEHNGLALERPPFELVAPSAGRRRRIARVGITRAVDQPWRFSLAGSTFVSRPRPRA